MRNRLHEAVTDISTGASIAGRKFLDLVLPPQCLLTGERVTRHGDLSPAAWQQLDFIERPWCPACGLPYQVDPGGGMECGACAAEDGFGGSLVSAKGLDQVRAALRYDDLSGRLVLGLKYADRLDSVRALARLLIRGGQDLLAERGALIVPVPLHVSRIRARRFNQSALLVQALTELSGHEQCLHLIERVRATPQQQGLSEKARERNVRGAFRIPASLRDTVRGRRIILVDDVLTTGSTMKACAAVLKRAGASHVSGLVLARVVREGAAAI